jgi:hypothetical protein
MAIFARLCLALVVAGFLAAADPIARLQFSDGVSRTSADFAGQHVLLYQFSGH